MKNILLLLLLFNTAMASYLPNAVTSLKLDTVYSASVTSTTGAVANENRDFIASCTAANPTVCTFTAGIFNVAPNCLASNVAGSGSVATPNIYSVSATGFTMRTIDSRNGADLATILMAVACEKSTTDYISASSDVYTQSSANVGWTSYTPTFTASVGTISAVNIRWRRIGDTMEIMGNFTNATPTSALASMTIPSGYTINTAATNSATTAGAGTSCGTFIPSGNATFAQCVVNTGTATDKVYFGGAHNSTSKLIPVTGFSVAYATGGVWSLNIKVPILGWENASYIVGSFKDYSAVPGLAANIRTEHIIVSYGTGNPSTVCSGSPCSSIAQNGTGALRIERAAAGVYNIVFARTYLTAHCVVSAANASINLMGSATPMITAGSALSFYTSNASAYVDSFGTISCDVTY